MQNEQHTQAEELKADEVIVLGHTVIETVIPEPDAVSMLTRVRDCLNELP